MGQRVRGMGAVLKDLIKKTRKGEVSWDKGPFGNSWVTKIGNLQFLIEWYQKGGVDFCVDEIKTITTPNGEVSDQRFLGSFVSSELSQLPGLMCEIRNQQMQRPEYLKRIRKEERRARTEAEQRARAVQKMAKKIAKRYFPSSK